MSGMDVNIDRKVLRTRPTEVSDCSAVAETSDMGRKASWPPRIELQAPKPVVGR